MNVPYKIVIEPQEYKEYKAVHGKEKLLKLPFSNLGQGGIPARNWVWEHSIKQGTKRHWILDDNIKGFYRLNKNKKIQVNSGTIFKTAEDFIDRYKNVSMAGFNYQWFCIDVNKIPAFYLNTRIYSCILLDNNISHRWRGKYNEDTDLSLRILKDGYCTILFNAFLCNKLTTMVMKGGNTDNVYIDGDKRMKFVKSLQKQHPDVVKIVWRYNRWHHEVDYRSFKKNKLIRKKEFKNLPDRINNYGMEIIDIEKNNE
jgi:hypothetical protein